jgi:D-xylose transport system ATP-binding protein
VACVPADVLLDFAGVTKRFPGVTALSDVTFQVRRGEIHGLCGENGAGKSTLMKILCGIYPHGSYDGTIRYDGQELRLEASSIRQAIEAGIAIVHQELTLIPKLTVGENIFFGKEPRRGLRIDWDKLYADTSALLARYKLPISPFDVVERLGVGQMQMTEIAKALSESARILILDEPTSALSEAEVATLMAILRELKSQGVTCIYITHKLDEFFRTTDSVSVLRDGRHVTTRPTSELSVEQLVKLMVGREMHERFPKGHRKPGEVLLKVEDLHASDPDSPGREVLRGVSLELRRGEILGIAGLMGSGRSELVTTLFGEYGRVTSGRIVLDGKAVEIRSAGEAMAHGLSLVPEDRKRQGLVLIQTILQNMSLPNLRRFSGFMRIDQDAELAAVLKYWTSLSIKAPTVHVPVDSLSGGNQQKVVISKWLMSEPRVLILDDPTRGIDVGAKYEIYKLMNQLAESGYGIIMISSELAEVLGMSDRVLVMWEGRSNGTLEIDGASQERIMARATGVELATG